MRSMETVWGQKLHDFDFSHNYPGTLVGYAVAAGVTTSVATES